MNQSLLDGLTESDNSQLDLNKSYYEELVGEGKKFADNEALAKSKVFADNHIRILETRMDQLMNEHERVLAESKTAPKLQELLDRLENLETPASREQTLNSNEDNRTVLDADKIDSIVANRWEQLKTQEKQQENFNLVSNKAKETLGDNFKQILKQRAQSLGLSDSDVDSMARSNPNLFFKTFDIGTTQNQQSFTTPPASKVKQANFTGNTQTKRTMSYWNEQMSKNPRMLLDPKIAVQMDKDAQEMGEAFFDI